MRIYYYSRDWGDYCNLGDWLIVPVLRHFGIESECVDESECPVLFGIGSILGPNHYVVKSPKIVVWGSGLMDCGDSVHADPRLDFRAVRGPLTRDSLGLSSSTPLGDPGVLVSLIGNFPESKTPGELLYVGHCGEPLMVPDGFDSAVSMLVEKSKAMDLISRIRQAGFVASQSLHGCILAAAFGVPWAPCTPDLATHSPSDKWTDWMLYLGLPPLTQFVPAVPRNALEWWRRVGIRGIISSTIPLIDSLPRDIM